MSEVEIFGLQRSANVRTALMVLANKGVPHTLCPVDFRSEDYKKHHPFSHIPAMRHGKVELFETLAIASYVDEAFEGLRLQPDDPVGKATMFQWISATKDYFYDSFVGICIAQRIMKPMRGQQPDEQVIAQGKPTLSKHLDILNERFSKASFLAGDKLTLADFFLAPVIFYFAATPEGDEMLPAQNAVLEWHGRMQETTNYDQINKVL